MATTRAVSKTIAVERTIAVATEEERTYRIVIEAPLGGPYHVTVYRQTVLRDADGNVVQRPENVAKPVHRLASQIARESVTLANGAVVTAASINEALPIFCDRWSEEDIAAGRR
jgi:hypothetical protein